MNPRRRRGREQRWIEALRGVLAPTVEGKSRWCILVRPCIAMKGKGKTRPKEKTWRWMSDKKEMERYVMLV